MCAVVLKKLIPSLLAVALLAAACTGSTPSTVPLTTGEGRRFIPSVVDWSKNVGMSNSVVIDGEGNPFISYLGFEQTLAEGEIADSRPLYLPAVPNVMFADTQGDGYWNLGEVSWIREPASAPTGDPLLVEEPETEGAASSPLPTVGTAATTDSKGVIHIVWTDAEGVKYATNSGDSFAPQTIELAPGASGASITTIEDVPWIAFYEGSQVKTAGIIDGKWETFDVGRAALSQAPANAARTAIAGGQLGPIVAWTDGRSPIITEVLPGQLDEEGSPLEPTSTTAESGAGGFGISMALAGSEDTHLAYYAADGEVRYAAGAPGGSFTRSSLAPAGSASDMGWTTGVALDDAGVIYATWHDLGTDAVTLATAEGGEWTTIDTPGTAGGTFPSLAVSPDGAKVFIAWYDQVNENLQFGAMTEEKEVPIALVSPSPIMTIAAPPPPAEGCEPTILDVAAPVGAASAGFDPVCLATVADKPFTIEFDNQDAGVPHNVVLYDGADATAPILSKGEADALTGPATESYAIDPLKPGSYFFNCFFHPTTMVGALIVK